MIPYIGRGEGEVETRVRTRWEWGWVRQKWWWGESEGEVRVGRGEGGVRVGWEWGRDDESQWGRGKSGGEVRVRVRQEWGWGESEGEVRVRARQEWGPGDARNQWVSEVSCNDASVSNGAVYRYVIPISVSSLSEGFGTNSARCSISLFTTVSFCRQKIDFFRLVERISIGNN